jgi:hypothetical protein
MISSKFVGPNVYFDSISRNKEYWCVLPTLDQTETRLQAGLLLKPPPKNAAYCRFFIEGGRRVSARLGRPELGPQAHAVQPDMGPGGLNRSVGSNDPYVGIPSDWLKVV